MIPLDIVAFGACTPLGLKAEPAAAAARTRISRIKIDEHLVDLNGDPVHLARVPHPFVDGSLFGADRMVAIASRALTECLAKLQTRPGSGLRAEVYVSLPEVRPGFDAMRSSSILSRLASIASAHSAALTAGYAGHAGALAGLHYAAQRVASGQVDVVVLGGAESYCEPETLLWLHREKRLGGGERRTGFLPGEGAAFMAVASGGARRNLALPSLGVVRGVGIAQEPATYASDNECLGRGLRSAIEQATLGLRLPSEGPELCYGDLNGERYRTQEWGMAIQQVGGHHLRTTTSETYVDCWGDQGAASGALSVMMASWLWSRAARKEPSAIVLGSCDGPLRAAAVLSRE